MLDIYKNVALPLYSDADDVAGDFSVGARCKPNLNRLPLLFSLGRSVELWKLPLESILLSGKLMSSRRRLQQYAETGSHNTTLGSNKVNVFVLLIFVLHSTSRHFVLMYLEPLFLFRSFLACSQLLFAQALLLRDLHPYMSC